MPDRPVTPWNSIAEGIVEDGPRRLKYVDMLDSPCASCRTSPCCTYLPLHTFRVTTLMGFDHAIYLLNFDRIELGLTPTGDWSVYYRYPCRFLDRNDFTCSIHDRPEQPSICVHFNPYQCWYRRVLPRAVSDEFLRLDRHRLEHLIAWFTFDEHGTIVDGPDWEAMVQGIADLPLAPPEPATEPPSDDPARRAWHALATTAPTVAVTPRRLTMAQLRDPCAGCAAYCCQTLTFPYTMPATAAALDHLRFCLGFLGIEVGISDEGWSLIVKATCRHLQENRCGVYGRPERPRLCAYYDAHKCTYRVEFGEARPAGYIRLTLDEFNSLADSFRFDEHGNVVEAQPADDIRAAIEAQWRAASE